jgi:hypothetical protein
MNEFRNKTCGECDYWVDGQCRFGPPVIIGGMFNFLPRSSGDCACGKFESILVSKKILLENNDTEKD